MKKILELENSNEHIISASILDNGDCYFLSVLTEYNKFRFVPGEMLIYGSVRGAKIGMGIHYLKGAKWIPVKEGEAK